MTTDQREASVTETHLQHVNNNSNPSTEDTVNLINNRLKERRRELGLPEAVKVGINNKQVTGNDSRRTEKFEKQAQRQTGWIIWAVLVCRTCPVSR